MRKNTKWERVETYPCPSQCLAVRTKNGKDERLFRSVKEIKTRFLWIFTRVIPEQIYVLWVGKERKEISRDEAMEILRIVV